MESKPDKFSIASYLVSLHTLLEAQSKSVVSVPSTTLADEYKRNWDILKDMITKENADEARNKQRQQRKSEDGTELHRSESRRS